MDIKGDNFLITQNYGELVPPNYGELVKRAKAGDTLAFEELYKGCYAFVVFVCKPFCESKEDLEDVTQDAFLQAFSKIDQLKDEEMFLAWIKRIAVNNCYRKSEDTKKHVGSFVYTENLSITKSAIKDINQNFLPEDYCENVEVRKELISAVEELPEMQRKMVHLYYCVGMSAVEISRLHKCTDSYVRKTLFNARNTIKEKMSSRYRSGAKLAPLGAFFVAEEAAFVASYSALNAAAISATAATVAGTAVTQATATVAGAAVAQAAATAKITTAGYVAACVLVTGLVATGVYHIVQTPNFQEIDINSPAEIAMIDEPDVPQTGRHISTIGVMNGEGYEENHEEIHIDNYADEVEYAQVAVDVTNEQTGAPQTYEPEHFYEEQIPDESQVVVDRTQEILTALANANNNARVNEIINQYGFSVKHRAQSSFDELYRFYQTNQGRGDILIGIREYEDEWHMSFRFFAGGSINMRAPDLVVWLDSSM